MRGELAVELAEQRDAVGEAIFRAGGDERGVLRLLRSTPLASLKQSGFVGFRPQWPV